MKKYQTIMAPANRSTRLQEPYQVQAFQYRGWILSICYFLLIINVAGTTKTLNPVGLYFVLTGLTLRLISGLYIHNGTNKTTYNAESLAIDGIYRKSRNPLYLSNLITSVGILFFANVPFPMVNIFLFLMVWLHHEIVIRGEEKFLEIKFNSEYLLYKNKVPRWLGLPSFTSKTSWRPNENITAAVKVQLPNLMKTVLLMGIITLVQNAFSSL